MTVKHMRFESPFTRMLLMLSLAFWIMATANNTVQFAENPNGEMDLLWFFASYVPSIGIAAIALWEECGWRKLTNNTEVRKEQSDVV